MEATIMDENDSAVEEIVSRFFRWALSDSREV